MTFRDEDGNVLSKTEFLALTTAEPTPEAQFRLTDPIFETYSLSGENDKHFESGRRQRYKAGTVLTQSQIDGLFPTGTAVSISPASGVAAGGTDVTITGDELSGVEAITFGGVAATLVKVKSKTKVTCRTPAHATGAVAVVIGDDSGNITKAAFYTYT